RRPRHARQDRQAHPPSAARLPRPRRRDDRGHRRRRRTARPRRSVESTRLVQPTITPARKEGFVRRNPALLSSAAIAIVAAASLVGCTTDAAAACTPLVKGGDAASLVSASGPLGAVPTVDFPR